MTDDQHGEGTPQGGGRWDPLPQGDYDDGATAFVQLPEGGIDALLTGDSPLAAPGHGYVPPQITATHTDGTAGWPAPEGGQWPDPNAAPASSHAADDRFTYEPGATQQWTFEEPAAPAAPGHDVTGQWSIPVAGGELPDESGEYTTSSLVEQWGGTPPATLPGGAPAPWATPRPWDTPDHTASHPSDPAPQTYGPETGYGHVPAPHGEEYRDGQGGGYGDAGHAEGAGQGVTGYADAGHGGTGYADAGHGGTGYADAGQAGDGYEDARHAEDAHAGAVPAGADHSDAGQAGSGHEGAGHVEDGHLGAGPVAAGHAEHERVAGDTHAGHADATDGDTPGGTAVPGTADTSGAPGGPAVPAPSPAGPGAAPEADAHGLAEAPERPAEAPTGHEQLADPDAAPQPATAAATASPEAPGDPEAPVTTAHPAAAPEDSAPAADSAVDPAVAPHSAADPAVAPEPGADPAAAERPAAHPAEPAETAAADATGATGAVDAVETAEQPAETAVPETAVPEAAAPSVAAEPAEAPAATEPSEDDGAAGNARQPARETPESGDTQEPLEAREPVPDGAEEPPAAPLPPHDDHPLASYVLRVNGTDRPVTDAWIGESLLYVLRERLGLAGAKDGCSQGECGACNVQVDGRLVASCLVPAVTTAGSEVRTVEGLAVDGRPSDVQRALARCGAVQCGFCVPGMAMTVHDLLEGNPAPTELETRQALCGNLCRCSGYRGVLEAVKEVVAEREASHAGHETTDADEARIPHQAAPGSGGVHASAFEAPGAFAAPRPPEQYDTPDPYGTTPPGPQDQQHYGQDGGQA
ncbi:2Fe-2S iron-sulfur cluster-binding protein [Streptomyces sp. CSDS2]|uniref:2Fe-2S iron-sulfur cluster-binding protein n=1 Tax=Streptomyces sp. CSDS2 TaxID=3055051 RepID=UPI0025AFBEF2|nr:2Fe-2S iron-sulfur cluster-binding protein [Streptomyces sp. CSDS2]MDN3262459.1 2Fe-2S iron-sulfur cluster-binding protein [Streptomyces sp. CSDS2]